MARRSYSYYNYKGGGMNTEKCGDVTTSPDYWDCECTVKYIHPKSIIKCNICEATQEDQPDSHANEVAKVLWDDLGDTPVSNDRRGRIDAPFLHFPIGTHQEDIWHWFEKEFDISIGALFS